MAEAREDYDYGAYCGLYCGACAILVANERDELEQLLAREDAAQYDADDLTCRGCRTEVTACFCADCEMRACARERGVAFCVECGDYPCQHLQTFQADKHAHHSVVLKNLETIREDGAEAWLAAQAERWSCPKCGRRFTWYEEKCKNCGAVLTDARAEERD